MATKKPDAADSTSATAEQASALSEARVLQMIDDAFSKLKIAEAISNAVEAGVKAKFDEMLQPGQVQELVPGEAMGFNVTMTYSLGSPYAFEPRYATDGSSAMDLFAPSDIGRIFVNDEVTIDTGIAFAVPPGFALLVFSRSGHGFTYGTRLANCVGVIDSDYRGTVKVKLVNDKRGQNLVVGPESRIAQCMLVPAPRISLTEVNALPETDRGTGGIGSTGN